MSYAAEPYAQFVEDLLLSVTGGVSRERFVFSLDDAPFRLAPPGPIVPTTLKVFGQVEATFHRFVRDRDFTLVGGNVVDWKIKPDGTPEADATLPDLGTAFFVNYDHRGPGGVAPILTDRNPGSVVRLLTESFAREYAVLSLQLEAVYRAGFLDTAAGRDLDQLVALLGLERRDRTFAAGTVVMSRFTPSPADIFVPEGTRLATNQPPLVEFETSEDRTLHRGSLSLEVPIRALSSGPLGVVPPRAITVIHRPILGIAELANPQGTALGAAPESDEMLRIRARRALEGAGKATNGALTGALSGLPGVREKDVLITEDPLLRPGIVTVNVAAELDDAATVHAIDLIESVRPVGVRVIHNLSASGALGEVTPSANEVSDSEGDPVDSTSGVGLFAPLSLKAVVVPASAALSPQDRVDLKKRAEDALTAVVRDAGVGEAIVYNRAVAALMDVEGVLDVALDLYPVGAPSGPRHRNVFPGKTRRPSIETKDGALLEVRIAAELLALDVTVAITLLGAGLLGDPSANLEAARLAVFAALKDNVSALSHLSVNGLLGLVQAPETFRIDSLSYGGEFVTAGVRLNVASPELDVTADELVWIRNLKLAGVA